MEWYEVYDVAERYHDIINPSTPEKILTLGEVAGMNAETRLIDFGCGFAAPMILWAEKYGISAVGIEFRPYACRRAEEAIDVRKLSDRLSIVQGKGADYVCEPHSFDIAVCLGASFIWDGYRPTLKALKETVKPGGRLIVGEPYWRTALAPPEYVGKEKFHTEPELLKIAREEGLTFEYVLHSSVDDWDRYEASNWRSFLAWLRENPEHPDRAQIEQALRDGQDEYVTFGREYLGWAMYVLTSL